MKKLGLCLSLSLFGLLLSSCSQYQTLNLTSHEFRNYPLQIIVLNYEGLEFEHLGLIKMRSKDVRNKMAFEKMLCIAETWNSTPTSLRTSTLQNFVQLTTAAKSDDMSCLNDERRPFWEFQEFRGHQAAVYEVGLKSSSSSLSQLKYCPSTSSIGQSTAGTSRSIVDKAIYLSGRDEGQVQGFSAFHAQTTKEIKENGLYYDQSCRKNGDCYGSVRENFLKLMDLSRNNRKRSISVLRDLRYMRALESKNFILAREILVEWEQLLGELLERTAQQSKTLILVVSGGGYHLRLPDQGKSWEEFEKKGINVALESKKVTGQVFAYGARAENFCGLYHTADIFYRFFWTPFFNRAD